MKKRIVLMVATSGVLLTVLSTFQNCSNVKFAGDQSLSSLSTDGPLQVQQTDVKVSAQQVPPLKLVFVVDNSYTMKANRVALSKSFDEMFKGAASLGKFDVTAFLISTAQRAPAWASSDLAAISKLQVDPSGFSLLQAPQFRSSSVNSGALPGDNLGFGVNVSADGTGATFRPATVLGSSDSSALLQPGIHKAAGADYAGLSAEFQSRLAILDSDRIPVDGHQAQQFGSIIDAESGMCAMARVLRDNDQFLKANEQAAFVLVSDEDENDPAGTGCVHSYQNMLQPDTLIKGSCDERATLIKYGVATANAATCSTSFDAGYTYRYSYPITTGAYDITYKKKTADATYQSPRTRVSYSYPVTNYYNIVTSVNYYACDPVIADKTVRPGVCDYRLVQGLKLKGDQKANCNAATKAADPTAGIDGKAPAMPVCSVGQVAANSCANGDQTCGSNVTIQATSGLKDGVVAASNCAAAATSLNANAIVDGSKPLGCVSDQSTVLKGSGACPSNLVAAGCTSTAAQYADYTAKQQTGDFSGANCQNAKFGDMQPGTTPSVCVKNDIKSTGAKSGQIAFSNADNGTTVAVNADCGPITPAAQSNAVAQGMPAGTSGATCVISGYYQGPKGNGSTAGADACAADARSVTDQSQGVKRNPKSQYVAASAGSAVKQLDAVPRTIACTDRCADVNNVVCNGNQDAQTTVQDFLKANFQATSCEAVVSTTSSQAFADRKLADKDLICVGTPAKPKYLVYDPNATYRKTNLVTDMVAGSSNLTDYINQRSGEIFGKLKPMVSVFVRTTVDGPGEGGSVGTQYDIMSKSMGGQSDSVMSPTYGGALAKLSGIIQDRLQRTFVISDMKPFQAIHAVQIQRGGVGDFQPLDPAFWNAAGNAVTVESAVALSLDDHLRFQYY